MKVPTFTSQALVKEDGTPTPYMQQLMDIMLQQMQISISDDGFAIPPQTTSSIQNIVNSNNPNAKGPGTIWYDTTVNKFVGNENGILVTFNTTSL